MQASESLLSQLPPELLCQIVEYLDDPDYRSIITFNRIIDPTRLRAPEVRPGSRYHPTLALYQTSKFFRELILAHPRYLRREGVLRFQIHYGALSYVASFTRAYLACLVTLKAADKVTRRAVRLLESWEPKTMRSLLNYLPLLRYGQHRAIPKARLEEYLKLHNQVLSRFSEPFNDVYRAVELCRTLLDSALRRLNNERDTTLASDASL